MKKCWNYIIISKMTKEKQKPQSSETSSEQS